MSEASGDWGTIRLRNGLSLEEAAQRLRTLEEPPVLLCPDAGELLDIAVGLMEILRLGWTVWMDSDAIAADLYGDDSGGPALPDRLIALDEQDAAAIAGLDLAAEFSASGRRWVEADDDGRPWLVHPDGRRELIGPADDVFAMLTDAVAEAQEAGSLEAERSDGDPGNPQDDAS
ncbi:hypothetical protein [uncultured Nocardioides sp.]|mgnify:CR=1 FL=1|uniref:hypothetical protein n=1 Tax=uncultured Nocardioides sp. TaxID=198441 RepID=UPI00260D4BAB|nr:hypothetical protein [uncultured Nocardioides sp.]|tara:strand:- start:5480 stop:6001 length:522 start_codon:yes stop_codon:yes gene_type:complete